MMRLKLFLETGSFKGRYHRFCGYYFKYPDEREFEGLVSTISLDPPMLNWIFVDAETLQLRYGTRSDSVGHVVGPWGWNQDESLLELEEFEGFVAVKEDDGSWGVYFDRHGDWSGLPEDAKIVDIELKRTLI
jgi:hypothetical protein